MSNYSELVEALRCKGLSKECDSCGYGFRYCPDSECNDACHVERIIADAADAIEELSKTVKDLTTKVECSPMQIIGKAFDRAIEAWNRRAET